MQENALSNYHCMAEHNDTGRWGEELAFFHLREKGLEILEQNWRFSRAEVDIIARDAAGILIFVEVKTRTSDYFGRPEDFVSQRKEDFLARAASSYMEKIGHHGEVRFDIVSILKTPEGTEIQHFEDAFFPGLR
jgi:putative endonuclease